MRRVLLALVYVLTQPAGSLLAQASRIAAQNRCSPSVALAEPALPVSANVAPRLRPMEGMGLPGPLARPVLGEASLVAAPEPKAINAQERRAVTAARAKPKASKTLLRSGLASIARRAMQVLNRPSSLVEDRVRVDFTVPSIPSNGQDPAAVQEASGESTFSQGFSPPAASAHAANAARADAVPAPETPSTNGRGTRAFLSGTFFSQLANNAFQVTLPLLIYQVVGSIDPSKSASALGLITGITTGLDTAGTLLGGWLVNRLSSRSVLVAFNGVRAASLSLLLAAPLMGAWALPALMVIAGIDALARGVTDTARNTAPLAIARGSEPLKRLNSSYQMSFEAAAIAGPFLIGGILAGLGAGLAHWVVPAVFGLSALLYLGVPAERFHPSPVGPTSGTETVKANPWMRYALLAAGLLTLYPLKGVLPAIFAEDILRAPTLAAVLVGTFGLGGIFGSFIYRRWHVKANLSSWLGLGALGSAILALGWLPGFFGVALLAAFAFSALNAAARLSLVSEIQSRVPRASIGSAMGMARFSANMSSMAMRLLVWLAFAAALTSSQGFLWVAAVILASAIALLAVSRKIPARALAAALPVAASPRLSPAHGLPGRLIVVEGLDGSGKSTQMEMLRSYLEGFDRKVVMTTWNSSPLISEGVKRAKKARKLTPQVFALAQATDLADRLERTVLPALREGAIVLCDRYFYTSLARDAVRGMDPAWLRGIYQAFPKPDLAIYFRLPVETAIERVLKRSQDNALKLSEDYEPEESYGPKISYYEAGLDQRLDDDPVANFHKFQTLVTSKYENMASEFGFRVMDAAQGPQPQHEQVRDLVLSMLGPLSSYAPRPQADSQNIFDKEPTQDTLGMRQAYGKKSGLHFFFRTARAAMQERFAQLIDHSEIPKVLLHGNPHVDNYSKTQKGAAMADFDRARIGPYAWDIARFLVSLSLRQRNGNGHLLDDYVLVNFLKGYRRGLHRPEAGYEPMKALEEIDPKKKERSTDAYLRKMGKWAQEMRESPLSPEDPRVIGLLRDYFRSRGETRLLEEYAVESAGLGESSLGSKDIVLIVLAPKDKSSDKDRILLSIKRVREDPDDSWYSNPPGHPAQRMIDAAALYAPDWELRPGLATYEGQVYYGRQVPTQNVKLKQKLDIDEQADLAYAVGTQLGRGHRLSLQEGATPERLEGHLIKHFDGIVAASLAIKRELVAAYQRYSAKLQAMEARP